PTTIRAASRRAHTTLLEDPRETSPPQSLSVLPPASSLSFHALHLSHLPQELRLPASEEGRKSSLPRLPLRSAAHCGERRGLPGPAGVGPLGRAPVRPRVRRVDRARRRVRRRHRRRERLLAPRS